MGGGFGGFGGFGRGIQNAEELWVFLVSLLVFYSFFWFRLEEDMQKGVPDFETNSYDSYG